MRKLTFAGLSALALAVALGAAGPASAQDASRGHRIGASTGAAVDPGYSPHHRGGGGSPGGERERGGGRNGWYHQSGYEHRGGYEQRGGYGHEWGRQGGGGGWGRVGGPRHF